MKDKAEQRVCQNSEHKIIHLDTLKFENHELRVLEEFYCPQCNSFWREP